MTKRLTTAEFIVKAILVHGTKYDYSKSEYVTAHEPVTIICKQHGEFPQPPTSHLCGAGCSKCGIIASHRNTTKNVSEFINQAIIIHGDKYDYSKVNYINSFDRINIICKQHGIFSQTPNDHLSGYGCADCSRNRKSTTIEFIDKAILIHGDRYDYSKVDYINNITPVVIICKIHGGFPQSPTSHLRGSNCVQCSTNNISKMCIDWLESIMQAENIFIQHAGNIGEYKIKCTRYKADGYCKETNTIYEFYGDRWHGNPNKFEPHIMCNPRSRLTASQLYQKTIDREYIIRKLGYNVISIWENAVYLKDCK